jgi:hypothetical protein
MTCSTSLYSIVSVSLHYSVGACLGILPINILYFNPSKPFYFSASPFPQTLYCSAVFSVSLCLVPYTDAMYFNIIHCLSFFSFLPSSFSSNRPTIRNMPYICVYVYICIYENVCIYIWIYLIHMRENVIFVFLNLVISLNMFYSFIHLSGNNTIVFFFMAE